jgi:multiple sugar transport system substrate-binding protein
MGLGTDGDHLWGLPMSQITITMPYNPGLWEEAGAEAPELGWTWDDYLEAAQLVTEHTDEEIYGASDFGGIESWFKVYLSQKGKSLYTEDGELGYTADDVVEWWEMATEFREAGATTPGEITNDTTAGFPFVQRRSASEFTPDSTFAPDQADQFDGDFALAPLPQSDSLGLYAEPAMLISASARTSHEEESLALIDYIVNEPAAAEALGMTFGLPANQTNREHIAGDLEGAWQQVYEYEELVGPELKEGPPAPPQGASTLFDLFGTYYEDVMFDRADPEEQARAFYAEAEQVIADNQD